jgi:hypothetical protein
MGKRFPHVLHNCGPICLYCPKSSFKLNESDSHLDYNKLMKVLGAQAREMTLSTLLWVCLGLWGAINGFVAVRLVCRPSRPESMEPLNAPIVGAHLLNSTNTL